MGSKARRLPLCALPRLVRRALLALCLLSGPLVAAPEIISATYDRPTTRYPHAVLGDNVEHTRLVMTLSDGALHKIALRDDLVFEDTMPRLVDLDFDGMPEIIVVESSQTEGARLAVYDAQGRIAATPFIGTRFRWLAPVGAADIDGDGRVEIAYIDRPHLAKTLRIWRYENRGLVHVADRPGLTNHRIGEVDIAGGIRICNGQPEMILATADWSSLVAVTYQDDTYALRTLGRDTSRRAFHRAMSCQP